MNTNDTKQSPPAASRSRHGGRRPGAGAPSGNTNALKNGLYSKRLHAMLRALRRDPLFVATYRLLIQAAAKQKPSTRQAAAALLDTLERVTSTPSINQDNALTHARKDR